MSAARKPAAVRARRSGETVLAPVLEGLAKRTTNFIRTGSGQKPSKPFLFTKIPRTASTTMHNVFEAGVRGYVRDRRGPVVQKFFERFRQTSHSFCTSHAAVEPLVTHGFLPIAEVSRRFSFTFIRNPWSRMVSLHNLFNHWRSLNRNSPLKNTATLDEFLELLEASGEADARPDDLDFKLTFPQWYWVFPRFDYVGRFEHLADDFEHVCSRTGLSLALNRHTKLYRKTAEHHEPLRARLSPQAEQAIARIYKHDLFLGGYDSIDSPCRLSSDEILDRAEQIRRTVTSRRV